ncbi:Nitrate transmembrane transporter [Heracleum sosnowskyi]|uniref:Nitrate transmembrane transporter n=1 Tax=Heracleum sosnowskyi TaxID=360622 RepID=A0AAD8I198_9APIA|nr:Nitrate transmembrane transporter [Heracleum sosnowskyi]
MERTRFNRNSFANEVKVGAGSPNGLQQKKIIGNRRSVVEKQAPDLTDFMNDMFFGTATNEKKVYNLTGSDKEDGSAEYDYDSSTRSNNSRLTQEWLEEAKRMVASSPTRGSESPSRFGGSPKYARPQAQYQPPRLSLSTFDRRDPQNRSARRQRPVDGFGEEIVTKSVKNKNASNPSVNDNSPANAVQKWFSNILKPSDSTPQPVPVPDPSPPLPPRLSTHRRSRFESPPSPSPSQPDPTQFLPPRQSFLRKTRFQTDPAVTQPLGIPPQPPTKRVFNPNPDPTRLLSPPKHLTESSHRRSISSSTCVLPEKQGQSPPVESGHRRSISSYSDQNSSELVKDLNGFLKEQRVKIKKLISGEIDGTAKIVLSGPSNSTSSMLSAVCYSWLLETKMRNNKEGVEGDGSSVVVLPVINVRRGKMWKQRQAAWLFHHAGINAKALLFSEEVDLEALMMAKKLSILVVGQDVLISNSEVGSQCTILTDNYCEDAYELLDTPILKKLLLAGILLDTQNLNTSTKLSMTRDAEAVQLLSVGCAPNYGNALYDQLMQDQRDGNFFEALRHNYGKPPSESSRAPVERRTPERNSYPEAPVQTLDKNLNKKTERTSTTPPNPANPKPVPAKPVDSSGAKNKFSIGKWFGFGK